MSDTINLSKGSFAEKSLDFVSVPDRMAVFKAQPNGG